MGRNTQLSIEDDNGVQTAIYKVAYGSKLFFKNGDKTSNIIMDKYFERTARSFSSIVNILDPDVIVCGGGMSEIDELYEEIPKRIIPYIASNFFNTPIVKSAHGSSSGVRGAALLWD